MVGHAVVVPDVVIPRRERPARSLPVDVGLWRCASGTRLRQLRINATAGQERLYLGGELQGAAGSRVVQRLMPKPSRASNTLRWSPSHIASANMPPRLRDHRRTMALLEMKQNLGVGLAGESASGRSSAPRNSRKLWMSPLNA